ncbi:MAG TPA: L-threonylcarbamoyladenylate synthase [Nitrososphaerales archaeon]|nr:L-threonylcarbamoyladenylate synthase [Nitrososphaerales archaeon]
MQLGAAVRSSATIVFPTDTVYGLGSSPDSQLGIEKCFKLKRRDDKKPMPILFSSLKAAEELVVIDERAKSLAKNFWPGPLTLVLPLRENVEIARRLVNSNNSVATRIPNHSCCRKIIEACGGRLIGTSANISGERSSNDSEDPELVTFSNDADYFVKGNCGPYKLPSTVLDLSVNGAIIFGREGEIKKSQILSYFEKTSNADFSTNKSQI